jgi:hypothetical protein
MGFSALNVFLGLGVAWFSGPITEAIASGVTWLSTFVSSYLFWFATHRPGGIKLHPPLSSMISQGGLWYVSVGSSLCASLYESYMLHVLVMIVGVSITVRGPAFLGQVVRVAYFPFSLPSRLMWLACGIQFRVTRWLWQKMKGSQYEAYHLAISCLLFMPVLLTLPTTVWYTFFVCGLDATFRVLGTFVMSNGIKMLAHIALPSLLRVKQDHTSP